VSRVSDVLFGLAEGQEGFFTTRQAAKEGVSRQSLVQAARRGTLERYQRGVYRLRHYPFSGGTAHYWEALLWPQVRSDVAAVLSHETALRLHGLSDVNPKQVHITVPAGLRIQREIPPWVRVHYRDLAEGDIAHTEGMPVTTIERTLIDVAADPAIGPATLHDAVADARRRGVVIPPEIARLG